MDEQYTYSFDELSFLIGKDKNIPKGHYHFDLTFNGDDEEKILVVKISPPKGKYPEDTKGVTKNG